MTHSKRQLQPQPPVPPDTAPPLRAGAGQPQTLGSPEAHPGLWAHTCADFCVWIYMPTDLQEPEHTHCTHGRRPAPSPGPHVAGTPGQCRELPWEPGPASRVRKEVVHQPCPSIPNSTDEGLPRGDAHGTRLFPGRTTGSGSEQGWWYGRVVTCGAHLGSRTHGPSMAPE